MAYIVTRERTDGTSYRVVWREGGKAKSETFKRHREAVAFRGLVDSAGQRRPDGWIPRHGFTDGRPLGGITVREMCEQSVEARTGITARTRADYHRDLARHVYPTIGELEARSITEDDAAAWFNALAVSVKTRKNLHGLVSSCWAHGLKRGQVAANPFAGMTMPDEDPTRTPTFLTVEEYEQLLDGFADRHRPFVELIAATGLRWSEATALSVGHVDHRASTVRVDRAWKRQPDGTFTLGPPKRPASRRTIDIDDDTLALVRPLLSRPRTDLLFTSTRGEMLRYSWFFNKVWQVAVDEAVCCRVHRAEQREATTAKVTAFWHPRPCYCPGYLDRRATPHDLRHSHASWLLAAGMPLLDVSRRLGHEDVRTTSKIYGHVTGDSGRRAAATFRAVRHRPSPIGSEHTAPGP